jgi:predicted nuclease of predicted toxin-antitoxin system
MYSPRLAQVLRDEGHDVAAVLEHPELRAAGDDELFDWAAAQSRRIVTENIGDFCNELNYAVRDGRMISGLLLVDGRVLPRNNPKRLLAALRCWLTRSERPAQPLEWLPPAPDVEG